MSSHRERGSTLIESVIALLIFAIGILGLVGMQTVAARVSTDARFRSEAAAAADELLARMQSSNHSLLADQYATGKPAFITWLDGRLKVAGTGLPSAGATAEFGVVAGDPRTVRIVITWAPPREANRSGSGLASALTTSRQHVTVSAIYD